MKLILLGGAAVIVAGGAYMFLSGNSNSDTSAADSRTASDASVETVQEGALDEAQITAENGTAAKSEEKKSKKTASNGTLRLHPVKEVCIDYETTGPGMNGKSTMCHRKYAYERYEIESTEIGFAGVTQSQSNHRIFIGDTIYAIKPEAGTGKKTTNPAYNEIVAAMKNSSPEEMTATFLTAMNYTPTGVKKTIANHECEVHDAGQLGAACLTPKGLMLEQETLGVKQIATNVTMNGGDDGNYTLYKRVTITDGPDLSNGLEGIMEQLGNQ